MSVWEAEGKNDEWYTPAYIFDALNCTFDLDVAAPADYRTFVPAIKFITENSLSIPWSGFVWCNPPFGKRNTKMAWIEKMIEHNNGILLTPDRTSAPWWQYAALRSGSLLQVRGKIKFYTPEGTTGDSPGNGTTLFAFGEKAIAALNRADAKLGIVFNRARIGQPTDSQSKSKAI